MSSEYNKISKDPESAKAVREELVPFYYTGCRYRAVHFNETYSKYAPSFIECKHPEFSDQYEGECLGQCAIASFPYGIPEDQLLVVDGMRRSPFFSW